MYFLFPVKENFVSGNLNIILGRWNLDESQQVALG